MPHTPQGTGYRNTDTSREAAEHADGKSAFWRLRVMEMLSIHRELTADEIAAHLKASVLTIRPRVTELVGARKIEDTGKRRKNESGRNAAVWKIRSDT
jgi:predicted ArsR family transcriptional regulator